MKKITPSGGVSSPFQNSWLYSHDVMFQLLLVLLLLIVGRGAIYAQSCNCTEYIYLNEPDLPGVLKFAVNSSTVALNEVTGANGLPHWYPGTGVSELPSPHGLGTDLNGRLYIGENGENGSIRQFDCDGTLEPIGGTTIFNPGVHQNSFSIGNILFVNTHGGPTAFNTCTGASIGQVCLNDASGTPMPLTGPNLWGLSYNPVTEMVYATSRTSPTQSSAWRNLVWAFSRAQLEAALANGTCIDPFIVMGGASTVNPGDNFTPQTIGPFMGVTSDNDGNIYIVKSVFGGGANLPGALAEGTYILKYDALGNYIGQSPAGFSGDPFHAGIGLVWSETTNRIYMSNFTDDPATDCISAFDANTMQYAGTAAPNPNLPSASQAKAIAILKECCPVNLPTTFTKNVCGGVGEKFYLNQEAFNTCDGIVCGSSWVPTSLNGMTFDACDNSVTVTGDGCSTFTLNIGAVTSTGCGAQSSTFTICNSTPPVITATPSTCNPADNTHSVSGQVTISAPPASGTMTVSVSGGGSQVFNAPFASPIAYSIAGLTSDGATKTVNVVFSDATTCVASTTYPAPVSCQAACSISQVTALPGVCNAADNAYSLNGQVVFTGAPTTGTMTVIVSGGGSQVFNAPFTSPIAYNITDLNSGGASQTVTVTFSDAASCTATTTYTAPAACVPEGSCNCTEYIYLNEPDIGAVLKFEVGAGVPLTEVQGVNGPGHWYPGSGASQLPSPHGLGTDLNGRLYIGDQYFVPTTFRQFDCDGNISPVSPTTVIDPAGETFNTFSIGNILYKTAVGKIRAYNTCTGALVGEKCLSGGAASPTPNFYWGLSYNASTGTVYATEIGTGGASGTGTVWKMTVAELNDFPTCKDPLITKGPNAVVNPGENYTPNVASQIRGVTSDNSGNIYVVQFPFDIIGTPNPEGASILKYNSSGQFISESAKSATNSGSFGAPMGIIWSETTNRLYVSNQTDVATVDCISAFDAATLSYLGTAAPNPNLPTNNASKAIAIIKECCSVNLPATFTKNICGGVGQKFFLNQEAFDTCDGIVCGSSWVPTSLNGMTFDACDNSVTITGSTGCSTFSLNIGAVSSTGCGPQASTFMICNSVPPVVTASVACTTATEYSVSGTIAIDNPPATGTMTVMDSQGSSQVFSAPFTSPIAYSIAGLVKDGAVHTVSVSFSDGVSCVASTTYTAPRFEAVEAGVATTICQTGNVVLANLGASVTPGGLSAVWITSGDGTFTGSPAFSAATAYVPGPNDIANGTVTLTLTSNDPSSVCPAVSDSVTITILRVNCGTFPWDGN